MPPHERKHLVLLLLQLDPTPRLTQLNRLGGALAGHGPLVDVGLAHPLVQRHRVNPEIGGDLLDGHTVIAVASDPHDVVAELTGIGPCHEDNFSACPRWASQLRCHLFVQQTRHAGFGDVVISDTFGDAEVQQIGEVVFAGDDDVFGFDVAVEKACDVGGV